MKYYKVCCHFVFLRFELLKMDVIDLPVSLFFIM